MWYKMEDVKYWRKSDNNCQYWAVQYDRKDLSVLFAYIYVNNGLAQKLQYFCSP